MLKHTFIELFKKYTSDERLIEKLWNEIERHYSNKKRYYHTFSHLQNLLSQLKEIKDKIEHWDVILFTLYYHDIIYNSLKSNNEERSADVAKERLKQLSIPEKMIESCTLQILATKSHVNSSDQDTNYFTDADLSILGQTWGEYETYYKNVRKEYAIYPNLIYNPGRKKVITHFLEMDQIYKTNYFFDKFEKQAKLNLEKELQML